MKLELLRLNASIDVNPGVPSTLEIHDRAVFAKVCRSLLSEKGKYAEEPYTIATKDGREVPTRKSALMVSALPELPLHDRALLTKLYQHVASRAELDSRLYESINNLVCQLNAEIEHLADGLWGEYAFANEWTIGAYCKMLGFAPIPDYTHSLIDNCIALLGLCADIGLDGPIVFINAKSFLEEQEVEILFDQAFFFDTRLLLVESWEDDRVFIRESKAVVDLHFLME